MKQSPTEDDCESCVDLWADVEGRAPPRRRRTTLPETTLQTISSHEIHHHKSTRHRRCHSDEASNEVKSVGAGVHRKAYLWVESEIDHTQDKNGPIQKQSLRTCPTTHCIDTSPNISAKNG